MKAAHGVKPQILHGGNEGENIGAAGGDQYLLVAFLSFIFGVLCTLAAAYLVHRYRQKHSVLKLTNLTTVHYKKSTEQLNDLGPTLEQPNQSIPFAMMDMKNNEADAPTKERPMSLIHEIKVKGACSEYIILPPSSDDNEDIARNEEKEDDKEKALIHNDISVPLLSHLPKPHLIDDNRVTSLPTKQDELSAPPTALPEPFSEEQSLLNPQKTSDQKPKLPPKQQSTKKKQVSLDSPLSRPSSSNQNNRNFMGIHHPDYTDVLSSSLLDSSTETTSPKPQPPKIPPPPRFQPDMKTQHSNLQSQKYKPPVPIKSNSIIRSSLKNQPPALNKQKTSFSKDNQVLFAPTISVEK